MRRMLTQLASAGLLPPRLRVELWKELGGAEAWRMAGTRRPGPRLAQPTPLPSAPLRQSDGRGTVSEEVLSFVYVFFWSQHHICFPMQVLHPQWTVGVGLVSCMLPLCHHIQHPLTTIPLAPLQPLLLPLLLLPLPEPLVPESLLLVSPARRVLPGLVEGGVSQLGAAEA